MNTIFLHIGVFLTIVLIFSLAVVVYCVIEYAHHQEQKREEERTRIHFRKITGD